MTPPACVDCAYCRKTPRGKGNYWFNCAKFGTDCHAARFGGPCGLDAAGWSQMVEPVVSEVVAHRPAGF